MAKVVKKAADPQKKMGGRPLKPVVSKGSLLKAPAKEIKKPAPARAKAAPRKSMRPAAPTRAAVRKPFLPQSVFPVAKVPGEKVPMPVAAATPSFFQETVGDLPAGYGDHFIYLLVRDPHWMYAYWEIQRDREQTALESLGGNWAKVKSVLRIYNLSLSTAGTCFSDIVLRNMSENWYIEVEPNSSYVVEIGLLHEDGRFVMLVRSNVVTTPRITMSDVLDEEWMGIDFEKMYALSGGFEVGKSSADLRKLMEERLANALSSGSGAGMMSSPTSPAGGSAKKRGFWFVLDCELIVYGATEPDAAVTLQGKPVKLRPDGTFTLRFALPDGRLVLDAEAISADRLEKRMITPVVTRRTERPAPQILTEGQF